MNNSNNFNEFLINFICNLFCVCGLRKWQWSHEGFGKWGQFGCKRVKWESLGCRESTSNEHDNTKLGIFKLEEEFRVVLYLFYFIIFSACTYPHQIHLSTSTQLESTLSTMRITR